MKKILISICVSGYEPSIVQIGNLNMVSTRNIESIGDYKLLGAYVGNDANNKFTDVKSKSLNESMNNVVKMILGGEFLKNVKAYRIGNYYAVEGDVWGLPDQTPNMRGSVVGEKFRVLLKPTMVST